MSALEKIFSGYYEERLQDDRPDPEGMRTAYWEIMKAAEYSEGRMVEGSSKTDIMEHVSVYGMEAEKTGFMAGFRMAWELLKNMQESA